MMTSQRWALLAGLGVVVSAAVACSSEEPGPGPQAAVGGEAGETSQAGKTHDERAGSGGMGGDDFSEGGMAGNPPRQACGVAQAGAGGDFGDAALTSTLPNEPFVLERISPNNYAYDESAYPLPDGVGPGPWMLHLAPEGSGFAGHVALFDTSAVDKIALEPEGDHYRFASKATLVNYTYAADVVPGICLDEEAKARLLDDDGDCVADRLVISGNVRSLGVRGGDYEADCGGEYFPIHIEGLPLSQSPTKPELEATSDPLRPVLRAPGLYTQATASLEAEDGSTTVAEPLLIDQLIYGFRAGVGLAPGSKATWHFEGKPLQQSGSQSKDVPVTFSAWPLSDPGSKLELAHGGTEASVRFVQPAGKTKLRFLADAKSFASHPVDWIYGLAIDYAAPGETAVSGVPTTTNVCDAHADYCNCTTEQSCEHELFDYSLDIPAAAEPRELLLRFKSYNSDWAVESEPILIDDLRFE